MHDLLQQGIAAAKAGRRAEARALLLQVIQADERNEQAWLWLAGVVDDPQDMRTCLENVLDLNPGNTRARQGLEWVNARYGPPAEPAPAGAARTEQVGESQLPAQHQQPTNNQPSSMPATRLADEQLNAAPASAQGARPAQPPQPQPAASPQPSPAAAPAYPCPYCGAPTMLSQQRCTQCRNSLMVRTAPPEKRSTALTVLAVLWGISAGFMFLGAVLALVGALLAFQASRAVLAGAPFPIELLLPCVILLILGGLSIAVMRGLLRRERWAYFVNIGTTALGMLGALCNVAQGAVLWRAVAEQFSAEGLPPATSDAATLLGGAFVFCLLLFPLIYVALTALSYHDFFGPRTRLLPVVEPARDVEHYNNGVAYKNRGMWYMAVREWEGAVRRKPHDRVYLQALGLAYAQLVRRYPHAAPFLEDLKGYLRSRQAELYAAAPELERLRLF